MLNTKVSTTNLTPGDLFVMDVSPIWLYPFTHLIHNGYNAFCLGFYDRCMVLGRCLNEHGSTIAIVIVNNHFMWLYLHEDITVKLIK